MTAEGDDAPDRELAEIDTAIAALEAQRGLLGDDVTSTALAPLRQRRDAVLARLTGERRKQVTVLFADLVGFTELSGRLDAEDVRAVVDRLFGAWQRVISAHGGVVEKFIGDACMAVFGLHRAAEDDPHRAVRAGLAVVDATRAAADDVLARYGVLPHVRVGVDTGDVVVSTLGERAGHEFVAVGPTVNRASRLQGEAPPDGVVVSADTQRLVRGRFGLDPRPGLRLKGIDEPVDAFVVLGERPRAFAVDMLDEIASAVPTVGRAVELGYLQERLDDVVEDGRWSVVTVVGDAGVGKSRLLVEFDAWLAERPEPAWWFRGRAWPSGRNRAGALLRDVLTTRFEIAESDPVDVVRDKLAAGFATAHGSGTDSARAALVVGTWLGLDTGPEAERLLREPQALRDEGTRRLGELLAELAGRAPVVVLLEDLHWADDVSVGWLDAVGDVLARSSVLVVATTRPVLLQDRPRWGEGLSHHRRLHLEGLSRRESRTLLRHLLARETEPHDEVVELVVGSAEGNPFYLRELVTWLVDSGAVGRGEAAGHRIRGLRVPSSLRGVLQARLDSLGTSERDVVERAAVVGRVFWDQAVEHLATGGGPVEAQLAALRRREVVVQRERSVVDGAREHLFTHALLRDVAYDGVLRTRRAGYHRRTASWLEDVARRSGRREEHAALVAEHLDAAGEASAAGWYLRAGRQAAAVFALPEATRLLTRGLDVVADDDAATRFDLLAAREAVHDRRGARDDQRADLDAMGAVAPPAEDDPERVVRLVLAQARWCFQHSEYDEAVLLAGRAVAVARPAGLGGPAAEALLLAGKAATWRSRTDDARRDLGDALRTAQEAGAAEVEAEALRYLAMLASNAGDFATALEHGERALAVAEAGVGAEAASTVLVQHATTLFHLQRYAEAEAALERALPVFERTGHRYAQSVALGNLASTGAMLGTWARARDRARRALEITRSLDDREATATNSLVLAQIELSVGALDAAEDLAGESLVIARGVPAPDLASDALAVLSWVRSGRGDPGGAVARAREAVGVAGSAPQRAQAELALAYALLADGDPAGARASAASAAQAYARQGTPGRERECVALLAVADLADGDAEAAATRVRPLLDHLDLDGLSGAQSDGSVLTAVVTALAAVGDPRALEARAAAAAYLQGRAARIGDEAMAAGYLARPVNAALLGG